MRPCGEPACSRSEGFDESIRWTADWDCWLRLIFSGSRAGLVAAPLARYCLTAGSLSSQREAHIEGRLMTLAKAARRGDLTTHERGVLAQAAAYNGRALALARARASLLERRADRRRRSLEVAVGRGFGARTRLKAVSGCRLPWAGGAYARGRSPRETTGGILLPPADA